MVTYPLNVPALKITQPLGTFYVAVLPAEVLLQVSASDAMSATLDVSGVGYVLSGTQRLVQDPRLNQIAAYIDRIDAAFPNSIILAANYNKDLGLDQDEIEAIELEDAEEADGAAAPGAAESKAWSITEGQDGCLRLHIPSSDKLAAIIDGQHRLFAFTKSEDRSRLNMGLICSIFLDLPKPFQAQLFATINSTQKPVNRSLTYELFGYNISDEPETLWTPDKLAVFLTRKLATEAGSPLYGRIIVAPKRDRALDDIAQEAPWQVSTAVVVDGILRLISSNPKRDANAMRTSEAKPRSILVGSTRDRSPLRDKFTSVNDIFVYKIVENYLEACKATFWNNATPGSFIVKTVGIQALFDILRKLTPIAIADNNFKVSYFAEKLAAAADIDFSGVQFQVPAGAGRAAIRKAIEARVFPAHARGN